MADERRQVWWDIPLTLLISLVIVLLITTFVVKPFSIPSGSMEDTLQIGDRILVNKVVYKMREIERGDVIVFDGTDSFVPATDVPTRNPITGALVWVGQSFGIVPPDSTDFVKRVIGLPGDNVQCCDADGKVTVNGVPLEEAGYLYPDDVPSFSEFDVIVPEGKLWVMGDHRSNSADSRAHMGDPGGGFVPINRVVGRAANVVWPIGRIGSVDIPDTFLQIPAAKE